MLLGAQRICEVTCFTGPTAILIFLPEPYVPYTIEVSAATHAGEGDLNTIIDFTEEGSKYTALVL